MRRITLIAVLLVSLAGCAWTGKQVDYARACASDPACLADAKDKAHFVNVLTAEAFPPAAGAAGALTLALALWWGGKKKEKKS